MNKITIKALHVEYEGEAIGEVMRAVFDAFLPPPPEPPKKAKTARLKDQPRRITKRQEKPQ